MSYELELINAILDTGDMPLALNSSVESVFQVYEDVWKWVKGYYDKYHEVPSKDKVKKQYGEFEYLNTQGSLQYFIDQAHNQVATAHLKNTLVSTAAKLQEFGPTEAVKWLMNQTTQLLKDTGQVKDSDLVLEYWERVEKLEEVVAAAANGYSTLGIPSTIEPLDFNFGGWQPGDFIVVIGWTGSMKSWLSRMFAVKAWERGFRPLVISLEMNKFQEGYRFDTILSQGQSFRNSQLSHGRNIDPSEYASWVRSQFEGKHSFHLVTNEGLDNVDQNMVQAKIEQYHPDLVILDYHGLFDDARGGGNETERAKNLSKDFKRLAVKNQVPIIDVAAVTMDQGSQGTRAPELWEIAWSKQLTYDADLVLSVFKNNQLSLESGPTLLEVAARKNRRGDLFAFNLAWDIDTGQIQPQFNF